MRKIFKSKLFWISLVLALGTGFFYVYSDISYAISQFYATGSETFTSLPENPQEVPKVSNVLYGLSDARKDGPGINALVMLGFYIIIVTIVAIWRKTKGLKRRGKKIIWRLASFLLGPVAGAATPIIFGLLPMLAVFELTGIVIELKGGKAADAIVEKLKNPEERRKMGVISDPDLIVERIGNSVAPPALVHDDDSFTTNLVIAMATTGSDKTAFDLVAIPKSLFNRSRGNVLLRDLDVEQMLLPGNILVVRRFNPVFAKKLLPVLAEKILRENKLISALVREAGRRSPRYVLLTVDDYRKLSKAEEDKQAKTYRDNINLIKRLLTEGQGNERVLRQKLREWEDAYANFLAHPVGALQELGTVGSDNVQILLVDEDNIPSDLTGSVRYFLSPLTATVHELMHYYSGNKADLPDALEEALTSYYESTLTDALKILMDPKFTVQDFAGYAHEQKVIRALAKKVSELELANLYFSGNQDRFARQFNELFNISFDDFKDKLDAIFYSSDNQRDEALANELIETLN